MNTLFALAASLCLVAAPLSAFAAEPPSSSPSAQEPVAEADTLMYQGIAAGQRGDWKEAHRLMLKAWSQRRVYDIAANLARIEVELEMWAEAAEHLHFARENLPVTAKPQHRENIKDHWKKARPKVFQLAIQCNVPDARVEIGGTQRGNTPLAQPIFVLPGSIEVRVARQGYEPFVQQVNAFAGGGQDVVVTLKMDEPPPKLGPDARIVAGLTVGGVALVGIGVGIAARVIASGHRADAETLRSGTSDACGVSGVARCDDLAAAVGAHDTAQNVALGGFVGGGVLAGVSTGLLVWWALAADEGEPASTPAVAVAPMMTSRSAGLIMTGTW